MFDKQYKKEMENIVPNQNLINRTKATMLKEKATMKKSIFKSFGVTAAAILALLFVTTTAFAAWHFLRPSEIVEKTENAALSAAFESENAININQSVTSGNHIVTLLAIVSGDDITDHPIYNSTGEILRDRTYAVLAIQNTDGSPMPSPMDAEYQTFAVSPFIRGEATWRINAFTMNSGSINMVVDGIMYVVADFTNLTKFADRGVYLGVNSGLMMGDILDAFEFNEQTGEITANPSFDGTNAIFNLPLDTSLANPEEAERFLENIF